MDEAVCLIARIPHARPSTIQREYRGRKEVFVIGRQIFEVFLPGHPTLFGEPYHIYEWIEPDDERAC